MYDSFAGVLGSRAPRQIGFIIEKADAEVVVVLFRAKASSTCAPRR